MPRLSESNEILAAKPQSTTTLIERLIALGGFACLLVGVALVLHPFVTGILFGSIIAIATWPIRDWLVRHGLSVGLTATVLLLVALGTVGVPAIILAPGLGERLVDGIQRVQAYFAGSPELPNWIAQVPWAKENVARLWSSLTLLRHLQLENCALPSDLSIGMLSLAPRRPRPGTIRRVRQPRPRACWAAGQGRPPGIHGRPLRSPACAR
jgi:hypothetical protein